MLYDTTINKMMVLILYINALFIMIFAMIIICIYYDIQKISITIDNLDKKHQDTNRKILLLENKYEAKMIIDKLCTNLLKHNYIEDNTIHAHNIKVNIQYDYHNTILDLLAFAKKNEIRDILTLLFNERVKDIIISIESYNVDIHSDEKIYIIHRDKYNIKASQNIQKPWHHLFIDFNNVLIKMIIYILQDSKYKFTEKYSQLIFTNSLQELVLVKFGNSQHNVIKHYY